MSGASSQAMLPSIGNSRDQKPYYLVLDKEHDSDEKYRVHKILANSDEGRTYEKMSTEAERLDYIRQHSHDSWNVVRPDSVFLEDHVTRKEYTIPLKSPEYEGLKRLLPADESTWSPGTEGFEAVSHYFREHAPQVKDMDIASSCDLDEATSS